ncbi:MAG: hypothetical protein O7A08_02805 [SAR324 cluster bacterium]|nr:hypothetical protein [SAR324 cluster bacterium]
MTRSPPSRRSARRRPRGSGRLGPAGAAPLVTVVALSLFLSGFCSIISELSLFNLAEGLLGGTNANLTYTMGLMMFAMGLGSAFTAHRWFRNVSVEMFIGVECALSVLTMISVAGIYLLAGWLPGSAAILIWTVSPLVGLLVGLEIPIVMRINEVLGLRLRLNVALVMAPDYFGALAAFVLFTFLLLPWLGLGRVAWLGGLLNLLVAGLVALMFRAHLRHPLAVPAGVGVLLVLAGGLGWRMPDLMAFAEQLHYRDGIAQARETPYQRIVVTDRRRKGNPAYRAPALSGKVLARRGSIVLREIRGRHAAYCAEDIRLFINGGLQFSTCDEHRYHEMLVHPALSLVENPRQVLVLGGGDGLAVRELLKYEGLAVHLVELDGVMVELFRDDPRFARLNGGALADSRVEITVGDALRFLRETRRRYDLIVMDFPDPHQTGTARLYSTQFFRFAGRALAPGGVLATQSMSPLFHPRAFLSVRKTMRAAGFQVVSLQVPMLTFEHWGFQVGSRRQSEGEMQARLEAFRPAVPTRYLNREAVQAAWRWSKEFLLDAADVPINDQFTLPLPGLYRETLRR